MFAPSSPFKPSSQHDRVHRTMASHSMNKNEQQEAASCLLLLGQEHGSSVAPPTPPTLGGPSSGFCRTTTGESRVPPRFAYPESHRRSFIHVSPGPSNRMIHGHRPMRPGVHHVGPYPGQQINHRFGPVPPVSSPQRPLPPVSSPQRPAPPLPSIPFQRGYMSRNVPLPQQTRQQHGAMEKGRANTVSPASILNRSDKPKVSPDMSPRTILPPSRSQPMGSLPLLPSTNANDSSPNTAKDLSEPLSSPVLPTEPQSGDEDEITPSTHDVLIGIGRTCSSHPGNRRFHKEIYENCQDYFDADYKKGVVDLAIRSVHRRGGRFLAKKGEKWVVVTDHDRLERNTRKSFHQARKQREAQADRVREEQLQGIRSPPHPMILHHHEQQQQQQQQQQHCQQEHYNMPPPRAQHSKGLREGLSVALYRRSVGAYCIGKIEAQSKGLYLLRFDDPRFGSEWVDLEQADCRVFSS